MGIVGVIVAAFMAAGTGVFDHWVDLLICGFSVVVFIAGGNALNDYIDADVDKVAHPDRPIPSGKLSRQQAFISGLLMLGASVVASMFTLDPACFMIVLVACVLMLAYETLLKQRGFIGNLTIAVLTGMLFLLGGAAVGDFRANIIVALMALLVSVGREIAKDIEDMEGDEGRKTLPMSIGVRNASIIAAVFFIAGPVLSIYPIIQETYGILYYLVIVADIIFLYCAYAVFKDPHKAQKNAKLAMVCALFAFILGIAFV